MSDTRRIVTKVCPQKWVENREEMAKKKPKYPLSIGKDTGAYISFYLHFVMK